MTQSLSFAISFPDGIGLNWKPLALNGKVYIWIFLFASFLPDTCVYTAWIHNLFKPIRFSFSVCRKRLSCLSSAVLWWLPKYFIWQAREVCKYQQIFVCRSGSDEKIILSLCVCKASAKIMNDVVERDDWEKPLWCEFNFGKWVSWCTNVSILIIRKGFFFSFPQKDFHAASSEAISLAACQTLWDGFP